MNNTQFMNPKKDALYRKIPNSNITTLLAPGASYSNSPSDITQAPYTDVNSISNSLNTMNTMLNYNGSGAIDYALLFQQIIGGTSGYIQPSYELWMDGKKVSSYISPANTIYFTDTVMINYYSTVIGFAKYSTGYSGNSTEPDPIPLYFNKNIMIKTNLIKPGVLTGSGLNTTLYAHIRRFT